MADRFLKHIPSGHVYIYAEPWIGREDFVEVANAAGDALPEPEPEVNPPPKAKKTKLTAVETPLQDEALMADASRGLAAKGL